MSCEGWLKVELSMELLHTFGASDETEILPEMDDVDLTLIVTDFLR